MPKTEKSRHQKRCGVSTLITDKHKMKKVIFVSSPKWLMVAFISILMLTACEKQLDQPSSYEKSASITKSNNEHGHLRQTKTFSDDVVISWLNMQLEMLRVPLATGAGSQAANRAMGYCGIATYEAVVPGMPAYQSLTGQLTDFPEMPATESGKAYHWAASANAALAEMNRKLFPRASAANKSLIDNLEKVSCSFRQALHWHWLPNDMLCLAQ